MILIKFHLFILNDRKRSDLVLTCCGHMIGGTSSGEFSPLRSISNHTAAGMRLTVVSDEGLWVWNFLYEKSIYISTITALVLNFRIFVFVFCF